MVKRLWWAGALLALSFALVVWLGPAMVSCYYQECCARALAQALAVEGRATSGRARTQFAAPLNGEEAKRLAEKAAERLQAALAVDQHNTQTHLWLGRAYLLLGEPAEAAEAFSAYVYRQRDDARGYWELGLAYERLARHVERATYWRFDSGFDNSSAFSIITSEAVTASLQTAEVETTDVPIKTPYCEQDTASRSCFIAVTSWEMPNTPSGQPNGWWTTKGDVRRDVLFMHPPSQAKLTATLPVTPTALTFWMGIDPAMWDWMGDGVVYHVAVDGTEVFTHALTVEQARQGWHPARVDLSAWAEQEVRLMLATDPGPAHDVQGDWTGWGNVQVVASDKAAYVWADPAHQMMAVWEEGGFTAQDLIAAGKEARKAERYEEALAWYERAWMVEPKQGDPWYYVGLLYQDRRQWEKALGAYNRAMQSTYFVNVGKSDVYLRLGEIYQWAENYQDLDKALCMYDSAVKLDSFTSDALKAEAFYKRGEIHGWQGRDPRESIAEYRQALSLLPNHRWAHLRLGYALYSAYEDVSLAEVEVGQAIAQWSNGVSKKWPYRYLGDIYRDAGLIEDAVAAYKRALEFDPSDKGIREDLNALLENKCVTGEGSCD